jgi:hypothetical protein
LKKKLKKEKNKPKKCINIIEYRLGKSFNKGDVKNIITRLEKALYPEEER